MQEIDRLLCLAIDQIVDGETAKAEATLEKALETARAKLAEAGSPEREAEIHERKGDAYGLMSEHEQALLSYEEGLKRNPASRTILRKMVSVLMEQLDRPEEALSILEKNLLPLDPENEDYLEARANALACIGPVRRGGEKAEGECGCGHDHAAHGHDGCCGGHGHEHGHRGGCCGGHPSN